MMRHLALSLCLWAGLSTGAMAQDDDDGGMLVNFLQDSLSSAGRDVKISGFRGALAGKAELDKMTISDDEGVWLTLSGVVLDWNRTALFRGRFSVTELSAQELIVTHIPATQDTGVDAPAPEASGFSLPELPVSVLIDKLSIVRAELGEPVLGQAAVLSLDGGLRLEGGEGEVALDLRRVDDRPNDAIVLNSSFDNETRQLVLGLSVTEDPGGLMGGMLNLPGAPSIEMKIDGDGPLDAFTADMSLRTDGQDRVAGTVKLLGNDEGGLGFNADIGGDITPLLPAEYHEFFGPDVRIGLDGTRGAEGALSLSTLDVTAKSLTLNGRAEIAADGSPTSFYLNGSLLDPEGDPVLLPIGDPATRIDTALLLAEYDAAKGETWTLNVLAGGLDRDGMQIEAVTFGGGGEIAKSRTDFAMTAELAYAVTGMTLPDPALADAVGTDIAGDLVFGWQKDAPISVSKLTLRGTGFGAAVAGQAKVANRSLSVDGAASLDLKDLSRFAAISGQDLSGAAQATVSGNADVLGGIFDLSLKANTTELAIGNETVDPLLAGEVDIDAKARRDTSGTFLDAFTLAGQALNASGAGRVGGGKSDLTLKAGLSDIALVVPDLTGPVTIDGTAREDAPGDWNVAVNLDAPYDLTGTLQGLITPDNSNITLDVSMPDIAPVVPGQSGPVGVRGTASNDGAPTWQVNLDANGPYDVTAAIKGKLGGGQSDVVLSALLPDLEVLAPGFPGPLTADGSAAENGDGRWKVNFDLAGPFDGKVNLDGLLGATGTEADFAVFLPEIAVLVPSITGPVNATGSVAQTDDGEWQINADATGPYQSTIDISGSTSIGGTGVTLNASLPDVAPLAPGITGPLALRATAAQAQQDQWRVNAGATGPYSSTASVAGLVGAGASNVSLEMAMPNIAPLASGLNGPIDVSGTAAEAGDQKWQIDLNVGGPYSTSAKLDGLYAAGESVLNLVLDIPNISPLAPGLIGRMTATGTAREQANGWGIDLKADGPAGAVNAVSGVVGTGGAPSDLKIDGALPLAIANKAVEPMVLQGDARYNLALNGALGLEALSGQVTTNGARLSVPTINLALEAINSEIGLNSGTAQINLTAESSAGGSLNVTGPLQLTGDPSANLQIALNRFVAVYPLLMKTALDGNVGFSGPLAGGATISGAINLLETEVRIPEAGLGFAGDIPEISHSNEPAGVLLTRKRAGLIQTEKAPSGPPVSYNLDLAIQVADPIFIRGRGLNVEFGGGMRLGGTTVDMVPLGEFTLNRGQVEIAGKRLVFQKGLIRLEGGLIPVLDLTATSDSGEYTFKIDITGAVTAPDIRFYSDPELPEDEVLARFLFGKDITDLTPLQTAQLAATVARLSGRGGDGLFSRIQDSIGVDNLELTTDEDGAAELRVGKYISDNIYSDFTATADGGTEINLNMDITDNFTLRGSTGSDGDSSIGILFQKDY